MTSRSRTLLSYVTDSKSLTTTIEAEMGFVILDSQLNQICPFDTSTAGIKEFYVQLHIVDPTGRPMESSQRVRYSGRSVRLWLKTNRGGKQIVYTTWLDEYGTVRDVNSQTLTISTCLSVQPLPGTKGSQFRAWVWSNLDVSQMREAMKTEKWTVVGSYSSKADPTEQFQLCPQEVSEMECGKWGCEITFPIEGVWNIILEAHQASGQKQSVVVENVLPSLY